MRHEIAKVMAALKLYPRACETIEKSVYYYLYSNSMPNIEVFSTFILTFWYLRQKFLIQGMSTGTNGNELQK